MDFLDALVAAQQAHNKRFAVVNEQPRLWDLPSDAIRGLLDPMLSADTAIGQGMDYYLGPTGIPDKLRALSSLLDPGIYEGGYAAADLVDPRVSNAERQTAARDFGMFASFLPMFFMKPVSGAFGSAKDDLSRATQRFLDRLNQPGPMPTTYSNPIPGLTRDAKPTRIRAYHGSPHDFPPAIRVLDKTTGKTYVQAADDPVALGMLNTQPDRYSIIEENPLGMFDFSKMGTGEGVQAYGWGGYLAEAEPVARGYRDALSDPNATLGVFKRADGGELGVLDAPDGFYSLLGDHPDNTSYQQLLDAAKSKLQWARTRKGQLRDVLTKKAQDVVDFVNQNAGIRFERNPARGRLYEVNINANPENFLDWDKLLSEQPEVARLMGYEDPSKIAAEKTASYAKFSAPKGDTFEDLFAPLSAEEQLAAERLSSMPTPWGSMTGKDAYKAMQDKLGALDWPVGADAASRRTYYADAAMRASQKLREQGIPGIKYFDAMSRGAGEGSRNYVVFDENLIEIVRKYGIAGAAAMLGMSQADVVQAMQQQQPQGLLSMGAQ